MSGGSDLLRQARNLRRSTAQSSIRGRSGYGTIALLQNGCSNCTSPFDRTGYGVGSRALARRQKRHLSFIGGALHLIRQNTVANRPGLPGLVREVGAKLLFQGPDQRRCHGIVVAIGNAVAVTS